MKHQGKIYGYLYHGHKFSPKAIAALFIPDEWIGGRPRSAEEILDYVARQRRIRRAWRSTYTHRQFPVPLYRDDVTEDDTCLFEGTFLIPRNELDDEPGPDEGDES